MTLESTLPWLSVAAAAGAAVLLATGQSGDARRILKTTAYAALGLFAYLRGVAPSSIAIAFILSALSQAATPVSRPRGASPAALWSAGAWLVYAWFFLKEGRGLRALVDHPGWLVAVAAAIALGAWLSARKWRAAGSERWGEVGEYAAAVLMLTTACTSSGEHWSAVAGGAAIIASLAVSFGLPSRRISDTLAWVLAFVGQAAIAYAFVR